MELNLDSSV